MAAVLWTLPVPSTALMGGGVSFTMDPGRQVTLHYAIEAEDGGEVPCHLRFEGVEAFKVTYYHARGPETREAYDRLVSIDQSPWLKEVRRNLHNRGETGDDLSHMMIDFDDGPCYEVICRAFAADSPTVALG